MSERTVSADRRWFHAATAATVALLVVTAGCSGLPVGGSTTEAPSDGADTGSDGADTEMDGADAPGTTAGGGMDGTSPAETERDAGATTTAGVGTSGDFAFSDGDSYRYSAALTNTTSRLEVVWEVTDVSGEELTAEVGLVWNGTFRPTQTLTGTPEEIFEGISADSEDVAPVVFLSLRVGPEVAAGHSLTVGNTWTVTPEEIPGGIRGTATPDSGEATVEVTGTDSYAGVECTNLQLTGEGSQPTTYCVNPEYPFALASDTEGVEGSDVTFEGTSVGGSGGATPTAGEPTPTDTPVDLGDSGGSVDNEVDGLTVVGLETFVGNETTFVGDGDWAVRVEVQNDGETTTEPLGYSYEVTAYDESGTEIESGLTSAGTQAQSLEPGESGVVILQPTESFDPERVDSYEVRISCGVTDDGAYCE
jgi:hypothetical protein